MTHKPNRKTADMNTGNWSVAPEYKTQVLQKVRDICNKSRGKAIDWVEAARRVASITGDPTTTGHALSRWVNNGNQRREFPEWFRSEYRSWSNSAPNRQERTQRPEPEQQPEEVSEEGDESEDVTDASLMIFRGTKIGMRGEPGAEQMCLTDMWRANGGDTSKRPAKWLDQDGTKAFLATLQGVLPGDTLTSTEPGNPRTGDGGSKWGHPQVGIAYAAYLSASFHVWTTEVVLRVMRGQGAPVSPKPIGGDPWEAIKALAGGSMALRAEVAAATRASEAARVAAETMGETVEEVAARVQAAEDALQSVTGQVDELARRPNGPTAPPRQRGWKFLAEFSRAVGLPSQGTGSRMMLDLVNRLKGPERGHAATADMGNGMSALTMSPKLQDEIAPLAAMIRESLDAWGYEVVAGRVDKKYGVTPKRRFEWVRDHVAMARVTAHLRGDPHQSVLPLEHPVKTPKAS